MYDTYLLYLLTASPTNWRAACSQFRTLPPGSSRTPGDVIISRLCSTSCTGFLWGSASCSRLWLSSTGPCLATPRVTGYLADDCQLVADARVIQLRSADTRTLVVSRTRSSFGDRTFAAAGPQNMWNGLPPNLRLRPVQAVTEDIFIRTVRARRSVNCF